MSRKLYAPPPSASIVGGTDGTATTTDSVVVIQPQIYEGNDKGSSQSSSTSIIIVVIILASAIIVSASVYLLLRFFSRRVRRSFSASDVVVPEGNTYVDEREVPNSSNISNFLPLFSFGSITGNIADGGDCAVCLSKFEPHDQLRLLPLCCHAFHARCIDTWLASNQTCPLCRSTVHPTDADAMNKIMSASIAESRGSGNDNSFRIEIGSISRRRADSESVDGRRSYSVGSFDYIVDDGYEVSVGSTHRRGVSDCTSDKESVGLPVTQPVAEPSGENLAAELAGERGWLREYVDRLASVSVSSRTISFRSSGRFFGGSSRRSSDVVIAADELEPHRLEEEISELFRWLSGV